MITKSNRQLNLTNIEALSSPAPIPNRINEDAWLALEIDQPPGYVIAAVIDGAGARLTLPPLQEALDRYHGGITAATFASETVRTSLIKQFIDYPDRSLADILLKANETLQMSVADYIGGFSPEQILYLAGEPTDTDPRRVRLALPACVVTLLRLNKTTHQLEYAHAGDTSLLEIKRDGQVIRHTSDQMGPYDQAALGLAARLRQEKGLPHMIDALGLPEVRQMNIENGLRHNYVDEQGRTHPTDGCGVMDGLPELADYIESGTLAVNPAQTEGFCLLSDGMELLAPLAEAPAVTQTRLQQTGQILKTSGLRGVFETMQQMAQSDPNFDQYPRMKAQDDATGIYLRISNSR